MASDAILVDFIDCLIYRNSNSVRTVYGRLCEDCDQYHRPTERTIRKILEKVGTLEIG